ncbi:hypothetical protein [Actinomadura miaoliensis]|uniref:Uncharacterized protein n=1 Tax=Actinomadura miaoliensis TaxID=430685 RepID=A0ABP7WTC2_9ACTN
MAWGPQEHQDGLTAGGNLFRHLMSGGELNPLHAGGVVLRRGERAYADLPLEYSRFYGTAVQHQSVVAIGSPALMLGTMAGNVIARKRAESAAAPQWREHQIARTVLTDQRIMIAVRTGWLMFWHGGLVEFVPTPDTFTMVLSYADTEPVMLRGPGVPWVAVSMASLLYDAEQMSRIPGFASMAAWYRSQTEREYQLNRQRELEASAASAHDQASPAQQGLPVIQAKVQEASDESS